MGRFALSLHHLTALELDPCALVAQAGRTGCDHVCLFTYVPEAARKHYPLVDSGAVPDLRSCFASEGVSVCNLEVFPLDGREDWEGFARSLETGAALGATRATAHVHDVAYRHEAVERFAAFCDFADRFGLSAGLEFNAFSAVCDIGSAAAVVREADRPNGQLVCDVLHLVRNGGDAEAVAANADLIGYAQFCDGPLHLDRDAWWREAVGTRGIPGEGAFPLVEIARKLRDDTVIEVEVPRKADARSGVDAPTRIARAVSATREVLKRSEC
ncbi:hypothetical protein LK12_02280 [Novosphingobium malaysiense]|uniref:Xylose isomerase-like TIM barrel domain-containing protein n=1 Tax=Novosphingobium malaysiense TaxID=1348853 RepID=A0A0B1ZW64_9SPHN|nr:hypothetical protein LK12_02280 [Novosphingobium malaysiense]